MNNINIKGNNIQNEKQKGNAFIATYKGHRKPGHTHTHTHITQYTQKHNIYHIQLNCALTKTTEQQAVKNKYLSYNFILEICLKCNIYFINSFLLDPVTGY